MARVNSPDKFDLQLLARLQENSRQTHDHLGELVGLSPTAVLRRIRRLRTDGTIDAEVAVLAPEKLGFGVTAIIQVTLRKEAVTNRAFGERLTAHPAVSQCYYVTGHADFVVIAGFRSITDLRAFADQFFVGNKAVRRFSTQIVLRSVKRTLRLPISASRG